MNPVKEAAKAIAEADAIVVVAGAGMSVDSGLPDFRGAEGLWRAYPALEHLKLDFESLAVPRWFEDDPSMAWAFYGHRQALYREVAPHEGYRLLLAACLLARRGHFVLTSNVDGHFHAAGFRPSRVAELHGSLHALQCVKPCTRETWIDDPKDLHIDLGLMRARGPLPRCPSCAGLARPNVKLLLDDGWIEDEASAAQARFDEWLGTLGNARVAVVEIGAGTHVGDLRRRAENLAADLDARLVRINPADTEVAPPGILVRLPALEALRRVHRWRRAIERLRIRRKPKPAAAAARRGLARRIEDALGTGSGVGETSRKEAFFDRLQARAEAEPGMVVSNHPARHLSVLKHERVYAKPWTVDIGDGRVAWVERFYSRRTYEGMIEGLPHVRSNQARIDRARDWAKSLFSSTRTRLVPPAIYDEFSDRPVLPTLTCVAWVRSWVRLAEGDDGSELVLVFFASGDPARTVPQMVGEALAQVRWDAEAAGFEI